MLSNNGSSFNVLLDNGLIKTIAPLGEATFVITQKGIRFLNGSI
jgi:predicted transcriptional regulator